MFGFAFALAPLYDVLCRALGINGKVEQYTEQPIASDIDPGRVVDVELVVTKNQALDWDFYPLENKLPVLPGQSYRVDFYAKNNTDAPMVVQAVPNITPTQVSAYMQKVACFCFERQYLAAGESTMMPVVFTIDPAIPEHFSTVTLSYTLYDLDLL